MYSRSLFLFLLGVVNPFLCVSFSIHRGSRGLGRRLHAHNNEAESMTQIFFDISVEEEPIGRLIFTIPDPDVLPLHTENLFKLCSKERRSIDPRCSYLGCTFNFSPQFIEGFPQYRWAHFLAGKGRNAVGRPEEKISDPDSLRDCTHSIYGGVYYGLNYDDIPGNTESAVVLTVPLAGPARGSTGLSIVRVGESPQEWRERLLLNSAVLGWMNVESTEVLLAMARQKIGPPKVTDSGIIGVKDE